MGGHLLLDGLGMVPRFGAIADGLNAVWYLAEGNYTDAAIGYGVNKVIGNVIKNLASSAVGATKRMRGQKLWVDALDDVRPRQ